jgi:hypothetical protein
MRDEPEREVNGAAHQALGDLEFAREVVVLVAAGDIEVKEIRSQMDDLVDPQSHRNGKQER